MHGSADTGEYCIDVEASQPGALRIALRPALPFDSGFDTSGFPAIDDRLLHRFCLSSIAASFALQSLSESVL